MFPMNVFLNTTQVLILYNQFDDTLNSFFIAETPCTSKSNERMCKYQVDILNTFCIFIAFYLTENVLYSTTLLERTRKKVGRKPKYLQGILLTLLIHLIINVIRVYYRKYNYKYTT